MGATAVRSGPGPLDPTPLRPVGFEPASGADRLAGQAGDDLLVGQADGDRLAAPSEATGGTDRRFEFKPVPPSLDETFDRILSGISGPLPPPEPFPEERFEMLLRTPEELAGAVNVTPDLVKRAGELGLQALRGVASSMAHDAADAERLDALLTELEETGLNDLADRLREQRDMMIIDPNGFSRLLPSKEIRRQLELSEDTASVLAEVPGSSLLPLLDRGAKGESERRERFKRERLNPAGGGS